MFNTKSLLKVFLLLFLLPALLLAGCSASNSSDTALAAGGTGAVTTVTISDSIETTGNLDAAQLAELAWKTSGIVDTVDVQVGDKVKAGDILATLKSDSVPASVISAQAELVAAQRNLEEVQSSSTARAQAQLALVNAQKEVDDAQVKVDSYSRKRASESTIDYYEAQLVLAQKRMDEAQRIFNGMTELSEADPQRAEATTNLYNAKKAYNSALATLNWYKGEPSDYDVSLAEANLAVAKAELESAQADWDRIKDGPDPNDLVAAQAKVDLAKANADAMYLIAPFDGEVIGVLTTPGSMVDASNVGVEVFNPNTLKVEAQVDETDIASVEVGNPASVTMDSLPDVTMTGKVTSIDPIGKTVSGLVKYTVIVSLDPIEQSPLFGATTDIVLLTSDPRTMLAVPIGAVQNDTQGEYVLRYKSDGSLERVDVTSDMISDDVVAISGDLKEGDQVYVGVIDTTTSSSSGDQRGPGGDFFMP